MVEVSIGQFVVILLLTLGLHAVFLQAHWWYMYFRIVAYPHMRKTIRGGYLAIAALSGGRARPHFRVQ